MGFSVPEAAENGGFSAKKHKSRLTGKLAYDGLFAAAVGEGEEVGRGMQGGRPRSPPCRERRGVRPEKSTGNAEARLKKRCPVAGAGLEGGYKGGRDWKRPRRSAERPSTPTRPPLRRFRPLILAAENVECRSGEDFGQGPRMACPESLPVRLCGHERRRGCDFLWIATGAREGGGRGNIVARKPGRHEPGPYGPRSGPARAPLFEPVRGNASTGEAGQKREGVTFFVRGEKRLLFRNEPNIERFTKRLYLPNFVSRTGVGTSSGRGVGGAAPQRRERRDTTKKM